MFKFYNLSSLETENRLLLTTLTLEVICELYLRTGHLHLIGGKIWLNLLNVGLQNRLLGLEQKDSVCGMYLSDNPVDPWGLTLTTATYKEVT